MNRDDASEELTLCTPDGFVRIRRESLNSLNLEHVQSAIDMTLAASSGVDLGTTFELSGWTEWRARWRETEVSIGWDWALCGDLIIVLNPAEIRSNILVVSNGGYVEPSLPSRIFLLERIESLPWRSVVIPELTARSRAAENDAG